MNRWFTVSLLALSFWAHAESVPGMKQFLVDGEHQQSVISAAMWYPTPQKDKISRYAENPVFNGVAVIVDAERAAGRFPVILLSHGMGGGLQSVAWLGTGLAKQGALVVAVAHPGSKFSDFDKDRLFNHWTRVQDLQAVIKHLEQNPDFQKKIDWQRVYVAGFSYGGWTALSMAGVTGNLAGYQQHCERVGDDGQGCDIFGKAGVDINSLNAELWDASYKDDRIQGAAAIDPGLIYGLQPANVEAVIGSVSLIGLGEKTSRLPAADFSSTGSNFAALLPEAKITEIIPANHFTAMPECRPEGASILKAENDDPVCTDPPGTDRVKVHARIIKTITSAFDLKGERDLFE